jgi:hypothetical protein
MPDITAPNAGAYGVWGPQYAAALAAQANSPVAGPLNMLALSSRAQGEQGGYGAALDTTQQRQLELARAEANTKIQEQLIQQLAPLATAGATGYANPVMQQFGIMPNAQAGGAIDDAALQNVFSNVFKNRATGVTDLRESGVGQDNAALAETLMPTNPAAPLAPFSNIITPGNANDATRASASMIAAQAAMKNANRPVTARNDPEDFETVTTEETDPSTGNVVRRSRRQRVGGGAAPAPVAMPGPVQTWAEKEAAIAAALNARR